MSAWCPVLGRCTKTGTCSLVLSGSRTNWSCHRFQTYRSRQHALIDLTGKLVGINTAIIGPNGGNVGLGFAIPIDLIVTRMTQLIENGEVRRGLLGVHIEDVTPAIAVGRYVGRLSGQAGPGGRNPESHRRRPEHGRNPRHRGAGIHSLLRGS